MIDFFLIIIIILYTRLLVPFLLPSFNGGDVKFHLLFIKRIKENGNKIPKYGNDNFLFKCEFNYPVLYHWLLSFFPEKKLLIISKISGLIIDLIYAILVYKVSLFIFPDLDPFLSVLLFITIPQLVFLDNRAHSLSPRPFGELLLSLSIVFLGIYTFYQNDILYLILSVLFGGLVFLSSKGASQGLLLFCLGFSVWSMDFIPIIIFLLSIVLGTLLSKGHYLNILKSHIRHLTFFYKSDSKKISNITRPVFFTFGKINSLKYFLKEMLNYYTNNPIVLITINNLLLPLFILNIFLEQNKMVSDFIFAWIVIGVIAYLLTSFRPFKIMGGPDRYIEYSALPLSIYCAYVYQDNILQIVLVSLSIITFNFIYLLRGRKKRFLKENKLEETLNFLNSLPPQRLLPIPYKPFGLTIGYYTKHKILTWSSIFIDDVEYSIEKMNYLFPEKFGSYRENISELILKYNIDLFVVPKEDFNKYILQNNEIIFDNNFYIVTKIKR